MCAGVAAAACMSTPSPSVRVVTGVAQGTTYSLQWVGGAAESDVSTAAERELERIDTLLSSYRPDSTLEKFNSARSVEPVELPTELVSLLELAKSVHAASDGCFDPTVRPLVRAWGFDGDAPQVPAPDVVAAARASVGLDKLELLDFSQARKAVPDVEIDMSSIGQGFTAGQLAKLLEGLGSTAYLAEIGGELVARGLKPDGSPWRVGLENPVDESVAGPALRMPAETPTAVVTSGSYRHYLDADGRRFGHIIDPRTGSPVEHSLVSVTVVGPEAAVAAAWGTALLCLGPEEGIAAAERERIAAVFWIAEGATVSRRISPAFAAEWEALLDEPAAR